jgi:glycosyltransferase involved in cell wall biosynthesis
MTIKYRIYAALCILGLPLTFLIFFVCAFLARIFSGVPASPRLVWGEAPIINNGYWARAMRKAGYVSVSYTDGYCSSINSRNDYDFIIQDRFGHVPLFLKYYLGFLFSLFSYDVFFVSFNGFFLGRTPYWFLESFLFRVARKKVVVIPFGLDSYIYRRVGSTAVSHGLQASIPRRSREQGDVAARVDYWCQRADCVIPGFIGFDGLGRWDVLLGSQLFIDDSLWKASNRLSLADGGDEGVVYVAHSPNFRGFKGSEFVIEAIKALQSEGLKVELVLIEGMQNSFVKKTFEQDVDLLIEQLIISGHGLNAIEGMASGLPVICNLDDERYILPLRRWSFFSECPIASATPENLTDILRQLVVNPALRHDLGRAGREYVEKYHSYDAAEFFFAAVLDFLYGRRESLADFCHPLSGDFVKRKPKVLHPLKNGRLPD